MLAAGAGRRFGGPKQMAMLRGRPLLEHVLSAMNAVGDLERVIVVLGAQSAEVLEAVDLGRAEPVVCEGWEEGIAASLRCALEALPAADPLVIALGDQPGLTPAAVLAVLTATLEHPGGPPARAVYEGAPGHPVSIPVRMRAAVLALRGDTGAGRLLAEAGALEVECSALAEGHDVDTAEDLGS